MREWYIVYIVCVCCVAETVFAQGQKPDVHRLYQDTIYHADSSHIINTVRAGGSLAFQYNSSLDAPLQIGPVSYGLVPGYYYQFGENGDLADFNLYPEVSIGLDGLLAEHFRYRIQLAFDEYGFGWSDGIPLNNGSALLRYYSNSTEVLALKLSAGYQMDRVYFLLGLGYGNYLYAAHGIGPSAGPSTPTNEVSSPIFSWGITAGEDIPLTDRWLYLSPELLFSKNNPTNHPSDNFIPKTISLGFRLNLEWVLFEQYRQTTELEHFIYAEGSVKDCKTSQPLDARITAFEGESNGIVETRSTDTNGHYVFRLKQGRNYRFIVEREGYDPDSVYLPGNLDQAHQLPSIFLRNKISGCGKESSVHVEVNVSICGSRQSVRSRVRFIDPISNTTVSQAQTDSAGNYRTTIPLHGTYIIQFEAPGYFPNEDTVELTNSGLTDSGIVLKQLLVCDSLNVQSYFDFDRYDLAPEALSHIDRIAKYLQSDRSIKVTIEGHTDNIGTRNHNMMLSQNRANTLKKYLLTHGVEEDQIASVTGFGSDHPIADNRTESGRQQNRRVNIKEIDRKDQ